MDLDVLEFEIKRGKLVPVAKMRPRRCPVGVGFIDQISFTFQDDFHHNRELRRLAVLGGGVGAVLLRHEEVVKLQLAPLVKWVFGLELGERRGAGLNFYEMTWTLLEGAGMLSIGGQGGTVLVQITGHGLACASAGWEGRLEKVCETSKRFRITRVDLAYDDHDGGYGVDKAVADYVAGGYTLRGRPPGVEQRGNWVAPDGKGRTLYIGKRENGKLLRVYEKGRQLGDAASEWVRIEVEYHNKDREIPLEVLRNPGGFLAGAYTALEWIGQGVAVSRIGTLRKIAGLTYSALVGHLRQAYGGLLNVMLECEADPLKALQAVADGRGVPRRLNLALAAIQGA